MIITLPWPKRILFPNAHRGRHSGTYQEAKVQARMDGYLAAKQAIGRSILDIQDRTPVRITFYMPDRIKRDWDGMAGAIKHHIDGIAKALNVDDSLFRPVTIDVRLDSQSMKIHRAFLKMRCKVTKMVLIGYYVANENWDSKEQVYRQHRISRRTFYEVLKTGSLVLYNAANI